MDYGNLISLGLNKTAPSVMLVDLNSCFASCEQQANPLLRNKPVAVAAYTTDSGCILAASYEAKYKGVKTGMRVRDGKVLCPELIVLPSDPAKYRFVHKAIARVLGVYTNDFHPKSIDEFVLRLDGYPVISDESVWNVGKQIKRRILDEVGDYLRVSVGIGTSFFTAKLASNLQKPDGLVQIDHRNLLDVYRHLVLTDLHGINLRFERRLNMVGIYTPTDFYYADLSQLKSVFRSISATYWYTRLRGWDIDNVEFGRRSYGNSYSLPEPDVDLVKLLPVLQRLVEKTGARLRRDGYQAQGVQVSLSFRDGGYWHKSEKLPQPIYDSKDIYTNAKRILFECEYPGPVRVLAESCFSLSHKEIIQKNLFEDVTRKESLVRSVDTINQKWGDFTITPARMLPVKTKVLDRIAFGQAGLESSTN